jgi:hypothetical protein
MDMPGARALTLPNEAIAAALSPAPPRITTRWRRRAAEVGGDVLALAVVVASIPFVIVAIGLPIALVVRLLLWLGRLF